MREIECTRCGVLDVAWFCVCGSWAVQRFWRINVLFVVVVGESTSNLKNVLAFVLRVDCECDRPTFLATVFYSTKVNTSSICGYSWQRKISWNKPSPLSTNLCACPAGTYCASGTLAASTPVTCTVGSYCAKGSTTTAPCPSGHYCSSPSSLIPCPAGVVEWHRG
jgi:hypothetical protein